MIHRFNKITKVRGTLSLPGDKSISHRSVIFSAMANGKSEIYNCLHSEDVNSTINTFRELGSNIEINKERITVFGNGLKGFHKPQNDLYLGNSGTTTRLLAGILAAQNFTSRLTGDSSLSNRPMKRIIDPLLQMGAKIESTNGLLPIEIFPVDSLNPIEYELPIASAQIKSCILLAGLFLEEATTVIENKASRNHTEKMLDLKVVEEKGIRKIYSSIKNYPLPNKYDVPSDISTAAFFIILTLLSKKSELILPQVSLNETRVGIILLLKEMGADIEFDNVKLLNGEKRGDVIVRSSNLTNINIPSEIIPNIIDEIPILAIAGVFAEGDFVIRNAKELRHKESDRIKSVCENLKLVNLDVAEYDDGFKVSGSLNDRNVTFESYDDHRIAMAFSVLSMLMDQGSSVNNFECVSISNPNYVSQLESVIVH